MAKTYTVFEVEEGDSSETFWLDHSECVLHHSGYKAYGELDGLMQVDEIPDFIEWLRSEYNKFQQMMTEATGEHHDQI